jgi:DNA-binding SARP family transcriptional activator
VTRFRFRKVGALLAYLAFYAHRSHPRDLLIEILWPGEEWEPARNKLRIALSSLRRQLEPPGVPAGSVLLADRLSVQMNPAAITTDVAQFEAALQAASQASSTTERVQCLIAAAELYRGPLVPGYFEAWVMPEQQRLAGLFFQAVDELVRLLEQDGALIQALDYAGRAVAVDPLREEAQRELIRLLAAAGQPTAAQEQYLRFERLLQQEWGETPSAATRRVLEAAAESRPARRQAPAAGLSESGEAPKRPIASRVPDLPFQSTRFFGRERELTALRELLLAERSRLVTLTGPGGSGKTRLAIEAAGQVIDDFDGSVWFVSLADRADPSLIVESIRDALRLPRSPQAIAMEQVVEALMTDQPSLLVLDNFEHLVSEGTSVVLALLTRAPALQ